MLQLNNIIVVNFLTGARHTGLTALQRNSGKYPMYDRQPRIALNAEHSVAGGPSHGLKWILAQKDDYVLGKIHQQVVLNWLAGKGKPALVAGGWTAKAVREQCAQKQYTSEELLEWMQGQGAFSVTNMTNQQYLEEIVYAYAPTVDNSDTHETVVDKVAGLLVKHNIRPGIRTRQALASLPYRNRWTIKQDNDGEFTVEVKKKDEQTEVKGPDEDTRRRNAEAAALFKDTGEQPTLAAGGHLTADRLERMLNAQVDQPPMTFAPNTLAHVTHTPIVDEFRGATTGFNARPLHTAQGTPLTFENLRRARDLMMQNDIPDVGTGAHMPMAEMAAQERITTDPVQAAQDAAILGTGVLFVPNVPTPPAEPTTRFDPIAE